MPELEKKLLNKAEQYIRKNYPDSINCLNYPLIIQDKNEYFRVTFKLPELTLGGAPVLHFDKKSLEIIEAYHTQ